MVRGSQHKIPVEELQEQHLIGPAQESTEECSDALEEDKVVAVSTMPDHRKVVFRNQRDPGHVLEFHYASKDVPFKMYKLIDGHTYTLPVEVIRNVEGCKEFIYKHRKNSEGLPEVYVAGHRSNFVMESA